MKKYKKTYAIFNLAEKHTTFHLGKTKVHVSFTGGQVTKQGVTPATFTTADPIVQLAIEHSADFKRGAISLQSQYPVQGEVNVGKNQRKPSRKPAADSSPHGRLTPGPGTTSDETNRKAAESANAAGAETGRAGAETASRGSGEADALTAPRKPAAELADAQQGEPEALAPEQTADATGKETGRAGAETASRGSEEADAQQEAASAEEDQDQQEGGKADVVEVSCRDVAKQYLQEHYGENPARLRRIADIQECAAKYGITFSFV